MRAFGKLMPFDEALKLALEVVKPIDRKEKLKLEEALDRVISE
ncbi:MAG: molybdopterin molybdenumtransferase MoeA, partial [Candidatus Marinimicrobia bacterium]|nr:molybdopterin molybdenumtransferase MoeA [Candidatus Neomarinimicrobiota bacterium]